MTQEFFIEKEFDLIDVLKICEKNLENFTQRLPKKNKIVNSLKINFENSHFFPISASDIFENIIKLSKNGFKKSILTKVIGNPIHYVNIKDKKILTTYCPIDNDNQLLTGLTNYYLNNNKISAEIHLFDLPKEWGNKKIRIIGNYAFAHNLSHSIACNIIHCDNYYSIDGKIKNSKELMNEFTELISKSYPGSILTENYWTKKGKFYKNSYKKKLAISEELSEHITNYILGFCFQKDNFLSLNPFYQKDKILDWLEKFIFSNKIKNKELIYI